MSWGAQAAPSHGIMKERNAALGAGWRRRERVGMMPIRVAMYSVVPVAACRHDSGCEAAYVMAESLTSERMAVVVFVVFVVLESFWLCCSFWF